MAASAGEMATGVREQESIALVAVHAREKDEAVRARLLGGPHAEQAMLWAC